MSKIARVGTLMALVATVLVAGVAATPAALPKPGAPTVTGTGNGGEIRISWNRTPGARYYTVGWVNWTDARPVADAGGDWLSMFHYTTVLGSETSYTVNGLDGGDDHYAIMRATDVAGGGARFGGGYSSWSAWSSSAAQPDGQHGAGFCPITGLPLPDGGYLEVGESINWSDATFTLDTATIIPSITLFGIELLPGEGNKFLRLCSTFNNFTGADFYIFAGIDNNLSTDTGIGFQSLSDDDWLDVSPVPHGQVESACDVWLIPETANVAIYAVLNGDTREPFLYEIDLSEAAAASTLVPLTGQELTRRVKPALGQVIVTDSDGFTASGTGFVVDSSGLMVTNRHLVDEAETVQAVMNTLDGDTLQLTGTVLGRGILADLAVVQLPAGRSYTTLPLANSNDVSGADEVTAWGYPAGSISGTYPTITRGIISSKGIYGDVDFLQTDAAINPGNSGGPLIDRYGRVVGVNTMKTVHDAIENQGFAIASNEVRARLGALTDGGRSSETYNNLRYDYGFSMEIPRGWYLGRENADRAVFYSLDGSGFGRARVWPDLSGLSSSSDTLGALARWRWRDLAGNAGTEDWVLFAPKSISAIGTGNERRYRLEYRRQSESQYCIEDVVEIVALASEFTDPVGLSARIGVCEDALNLHASARDAMLNSFSP